MQVLVGFNSDEPLMNYEDSKLKLNGMVATFAFFIIENEDTISWAI